MDTRPSLERLKNLDSIPSLVLQLEVIERLCVDTARAAFGAKWLLGKLKLEETRAHLKTWESLLHQLRLLSPARIATVLAAHDLLDLIRTTLDETSPSSGLLSAHANLLRFLLDLSNGHDGTQVKAVLSVHSEKAALLLEAWLRQLSDTRDDLLDPALEIWRMQNARTGSSENPFAQHCLVSAVLLQAGSRKEPSAKRKRDEDSKRHSLELLIAKHVFVDAKVRFDVFETGHDGEEAPGSRLRSNLKPLGHYHPSVLPQLLDTALRSSLTSTHPVKESPWAEIVLRALIDCNRDENGTIVDYSVLAELLSICRQHASLSRSALKELYHRFTGLLKGDSLMNYPRLTTDFWQVVAEFVAMDADFFTNSEITRSLFHAIGGAMQELGSEGLDGLQSLCRERVVLPIMDAFAKRRDLRTFMGVWSQYLDPSSSEKHYASTEWLSVDDYFSKLVEEALTEDEIVGEISSFLQELRDVVQDRQIRDMESTLIVTNALLAGTTSHNLLLKLYPLLEESLDLLLKTAAAQREGYFWNLLGTVFEMWCPPWIARQSRTHAVADKAVTLLRSSAVEVAFKVMKQDMTQSDASHTPVDVTIKAATFVASLCSTFHNYQAADSAACYELCVQSATELVNTLGSAALDVVMLYPATLHIIDSDSRRAYMSKLMKASAAEETSLAQQDLTVQALQSMASTAPSHLRSEVVEQLTALALEYLQLPTSRSIALKLLHHIPARWISRQQREAALEAISESQSMSRASHVDNRNLQFAVITHLEALSKDDLQARLKHRDASTFKAFLELLCEHAMGISIDEHDDAIRLAPALGTPHAIPDGLIDDTLHQRVDENRQSVMEHWLRLFRAQSACAHDCDSPQSLYPLQVVLVAQFGVCCIYGSANGGVEFAKQASSIIDTVLPPVLHQTLIASVTVYLAKLDDVQKIELIESGLPPTLIQTCLAQIDETAIDSEIRSRLRVAISGLLNSHQQRLTTAASAILRSKPLLTNQHTVEAILASILKTLRNHDLATADGIDMMFILLLQYRARLRGRSHLVVIIFQAMISAMFEKPHTRAAVVVHDANRVAELLVMFCEPSRTQWKAKAASLIDEARKEQAYIGQSIQHVLQHYCHQVLSTTPVEGVRDALRPGVWSMIEAVEMNDAMGIKALSAAMNNSERAVLRDVYGDWRQFGKWQGG